MTATQSSVLFDERRRHPRCRVSSIIYVKLDDGNGGILLNLGIGGLSFQAVAALRPEQDVVLNFGLFDTSETITVAGRIAWLGPTRKEAGLRFKELPHRSEQSIVEWMSNDEKSADSIEPSVANTLSLLPEKSEASLQPPEAPVVVISKPEAIPDPPAPKRALPSHALLGNPAAWGKSRTSLALEESSPFPTPTNVLRFGQSSAASVWAPTPLRPELPQPDSPQPQLLQPDASQPEPLQPISRPEAPGPAASSKPVVRSNQTLFSPPARVAQNRGAHQEPRRTSAASPLEERRRRNLFFLFGLTASLGLAVLVFAVLSFSALPDGADALAVSASGVSDAAASPVDPVVGTTMRWRVETTFKEIFLGTVDNPVLASSETGVAVWTDQKRGFYYCLGSPYFAKFQPGSLVTQAEALQDGYQPRLGNYCQ